MTLMGSLLNTMEFQARSVGVRRYQNEDVTLTDAGNAVVARLAMNQAVDRQDK